MKPERIHWGKIHRGNLPGGGGGEFDQVGIHRGGFHIKCAPWKIFEQIGIGMSYLHVFLIEMRGIDTAVGAYACMLELFCENS